MQTISITTAHDGARLDVALAAMLGASRSAVQHAIREGGAKLNGKTASAHAPVKAGDIVELLTDVRLPESARAVTGSPDLPLSILYDDDDIVVVDKPAGLLVHPTLRNETDTLASALLARYPGMRAVGDSPLRPGIVHRLDKDASGTLVAAKTQPAYASLKRQFQEHAIKKEYMVLVHGSPPKDEGTVSLAIGRATRGGKMAARHRAMAGDRPAVTHYRVIEHLPAAAVVSVRTETGRTHQIRAHFKALGCAVVGDPLYAPQKKKRLPAPRLFLHAMRLGFAHPRTGKWMEFESPLPPELLTFLTILRS